MVENKRLGEPGDILRRMNFGHAIERALSEFRQLLRQILAAEDAALQKRPVDLRHRLAARIEIDGELLEEAGFEGKPDALDASQPGRRLMRPRDDEFTNLVVQV